MDSQNCIAIQIHPPPDSPSQPSDPSSNSDAYRYNAISTSQSDVVSQSNSPSQQNAVNQPNIFEQNAQHQSQPRQNGIQQNLANEFVYLRLTRNLMFVYTMWNLILILTSISYMSIYWQMRCDKDIQVWIFMNTISLSCSLMLRLYMYKYDINYQNIHLHNHTAKLIRYVPFFDLCVFLYGALILKFDDSYCAEATPYLYHLSLILFTYKLIQTFLPGFVMILICCRLSCLVTFLPYFSEKRGASQQDINNLPIKKCTRVETDYGCSICSEDYELDVNIKVLPCEHEYHPACIDQWLLINKTCPLCRASIDSPV